MIGQFLAEILLVLDIVPALEGDFVTVLQATDPYENTTDVLLQGYELVGAALGLFIAYQAYRGYRRNDSRPMLFISLGFILIFAGGVGVLTVFLLVPSVPEAGIQVLNQTVEIAGLLCIIYALRVEV